MGEELLLQREGLTQRLAAHHDEGVASSKSQSPPKTRELPPSYVPLTLKPAAPVIEVQITSPLHEKVDTYL